MKPQILLLDEPTNGLDVDSKQRLIEVINKINRPKSLSVTILRCCPLLAQSSQRFETAELNRLQNRKCMNIGTLPFYGGVPHTHHEST